MALAFLLLELEDESEDDEEEDDEDEESVSDDEEELVSSLDFLDFFLDLGCTASWATCRTVSLHHCRDSSVTSSPNCLRSAANATRGVSFVVSLLATSDTRKERHWLLVLCATAIEQMTHLATDGDTGRQCRLQDKCLS